MLINPNKTMERKRCALSPIFNNTYERDEGAFFLMPLITRRDEKSERERERKAEKKNLHFFANPPVCLT
jgi:hypothetical protein